MDHDKTGLAIYRQHDKPVNYTFDFGPGLVNCSWDGPDGAKMPTQLHDNRGFVPPDMTHVSEMF